MKGKYTIYYLAPLAYEVEAYDQTGRLWYGVFASPDRAAEWAEGRVTAQPYDPIPVGVGAIR